MSFLAENLSNLQLQYPSIFSWATSFNLSSLGDSQEFDDSTLRDIAVFYASAFVSPSRLTSARPSSTLSAQYIDPRIPLAQSLDGDDVKLIDHLPIFQYRSKHIESFDTRHRALVLFGSQSLICLCEDLDNLQHSSKASSEPSNTLLPYIRSVVLIENEASNLYSCLHHFDFVKLIRLCKSLGISFTLLLESDIDILQNRLLRHIITDDPTMIYGAIIVKQPRLSPSLIELESWVRSSSGLKEHVNSMLGFDSDEVTQSAHAVWSALKVRPCKLLSQLDLCKKLPVVLTASGFSLDESLPWLKHNQSKLFIWASGSSLATLLRNGVTPSIVCVLERDSIIYDLFLELLSEGFDLSSITLLASSTIDPRIPSLFSSVIQFHRPASPAFCFFPDEVTSCLPQGGPQVVNAAFEAIVLSGFTKILMLGCDFGSSDRIFSRSLQAFGTDERSLNIPMSGNFGRTIFSEAGLIYSRDLVQNVITQCPDLCITRVGDGLILNGPSDIVLSDLSVNEFVVPSDVLANYLSALPTTTSSPDQMISLLQSIEESLDVFRSRFKLSLSELSEGWSSATTVILRSEISRYSSDLSLSEAFIRHHSAHSVFFMLQSLYDWTPSSEVSWDELVQVTCDTVDYIYEYLFQYTSFLRTLISYKQLPEWNVQWLRNQILK